MSDEAMLGAAEVTAPPIAPVTSAEVAPVVEPDHAIDDERAVAESRQANITQIRSEHEANLKRFSGAGLRAYLEMLLVHPRDEQHIKAIPQDDLKAELEKLDALEKADALLHHS